MKDIYANYKYKRSITGFMILHECIYVESPSTLMSAAKSITGPKMNVPTKRYYRELIDANIGINPDLNDYGSFDSDTILFWKYHISSARAGYYTAEPLIHVLPLNIVDTLSDVKQPIINIPGIDKDGNLVNIEMSFTIIRPTTVNPNMYDIVNLAYTNDEFRKASIHLHQINSIRHRQEYMLGSVIFPNIYKK